MLRVTAADRLRHGAEHGHVAVALAATVTDQPRSLARQILATMDGLELQWLRDPDTTGLVREWDTASQVLFGPPGA
ncbi:hypothetical protein [Streptomyces sp. NPDC093109]|uniref:hypothetical protein n=1 Tax=Streptomyces sp. NPDC093109 TaxID=3154977 RepID=UPI00344D8455